MTTIHASCVVVNGTGVLIRGAAGAGKSRLAHKILLAAPVYGFDARLVADDRLADVIERRLSAAGGAHAG